MSGKSLVMAPTTQQTTMVGSASTMQSQLVISRNVMTPAGSAAGPIMALTTSWRWRWRGGSHGRRHRSPPADRENPLIMRADGIPHTHRAQPDQICRDRNSFPAEPAEYSLPGNGPFRLERRVPGRKFVIAVDCGFRALTIAKSGVASHRHRDQATVGKRMCWPPLQARAEQRQGRR